MANRGHSPEVKAKALTLAAATSQREAAKALGIPVGTIARWSAKRLNRSEDAEAKRPGRKLEALAAEAAVEAKEEVRDYLVDRLKGLADKLYALAEKAVARTDASMDNEEHDRDGAAWLRSLVGVLAQSLEKAQLLSGKPTIRPEVTERREFDITHRIVAERPEIIDDIFSRAAEAERPRMADRRG